MTDVLAELIEHLENTEINAQMFSKQSALHPAYSQQFLMFAEAAQTALRLANEAIAEREQLRHERDGLKRELDAWVSVHDRRDGKR